MSMVIGFWKEVRYQKTDLSMLNFGLGGLKHWSEMISVGSDLRFERRLGNAGPAKKLLLQLVGVKPEDFTGFCGWIKKALFWRKRIVMEVAAESGTHFVVGYYDRRLGQCKILTRVRNVSNGPFQMRVIPWGGQYFVVAENESTLISHGCYYADTRSPGEMGFLRYDLL